MRVVVVGDGDDAGGGGCGVDVGKCDCAIMVSDDVSGTGDVST